MTWTAAITLAIAVLGAALGVVNTWNSISEKRVRLRVRGLWAYTGIGRLFGIEVTNLGSFAVTISDVGFLYRRPFSNAPERAVVTAPRVNDGGTWPRRLMPREQVTVYLQVSDVPGGRKLWGAYARTVCAEIAYGKTGAMQELSVLIEKRP